MTPFIKNLFVKHCSLEDEILPRAKCWLLGVAQTYSDEDEDDDEEEYRIIFPVNDDDEDTQYQSVSKKRDFFLSEKKLIFRHASVSSTYPCK